MHSSFSMQGRPEFSATTALPNLPLPLECHNSNLGGLETPRVLLASRGSRSCGLGNERDLVGRFYMTHLVSSADNVGALRFAAADTARAFDFSKTLDGVYGRRMILLSPEARRRERLPNTVFRPTRPPMDDASQRDPVLSMLFLVRSLLIPRNMHAAWSRSWAASLLLRRGVNTAALFFLAFLVSCVLVLIG